MKVRAKFIGVNSLGYENGKEYDLLFNSYNRSLWIRIYDTSKGICEYSSLKQFLNNWEVIS